MQKIPCQSARISRVQTPVIPVIGEMIARHPGTISLGQGVVHYAPPPTVAQAVAAAADDPRTYRYGLAFGIPELLDPIRAKLRNENGVRIGVERRIAVTAGSNMAFVNAVLAIADPGDEVILLSPYYFNHEMAIRIAGCKPVVVATDGEYQPDVASIAAAVTPRTRAVVTVSPNNPSGAVYPEATLRAINALCRDHGIFHVSDEAYEYFVYDGGTHFSPASIEGSEPHTIACYTLSKAYGMAGWRVGYMVLPMLLEEAVKKIQDTNLICPAIMTQFAGAGALKAGQAWCRSQISGFEKVRDTVLNELATLGDRIHLPRPGGAFYGLMRVNKRIEDMRLVEALISDFGVAVMPGSTFGLTEHCYLRAAYGALAAETVTEGIGRLVKGLGALI
ncbi:pyridoxal phosphate-dependent aminotransferase [Humisphaera borealis]|uniref:Pyridoxal phosphate-dependent aminotransferase n=1 Tax=Humisphaera borealis TaxID=2807512 RepID=A0A7M2X305_9BACT|nr:pyridoxal phosphate-dependent aminotransferase [Humisphaera borealis]QOV92054.1 pyridoxal phosphate-dependent aminotransferase [Humisphaera borealis]